jgi:hypothetical protein
MQDIGQVKGPAKIFRDPSRGKFHSSIKEEYPNGNEEESHEKGCQKEKEVNDPREAKGLALFL